MVGWGAGEHGFRLRLELFNPLGGGRVQPRVGFYSEKKSQVYRYR